MNAHGSNNTSLVSVLMTAYNREKYIGEAIESVLASSYKHFELIIVDDASNDNTVDIAKNYLQKDKRIKLFVNEKNIGQFANRNKAAGLASGEFLIYVDSDDKIFPNAFSKIYIMMLKYPTASFAMYTNDDSLGEFLTPEEAIQNHFFKKPFLVMGPGGTFMRRDFFNKINGYSVEYGVPGDMYFNLKAASTSPMILLHFDFLFYRRHEGQEINNSYDYLYNNYRYMRDAIHLLQLPLKKEQKLFLDKKNKRRFAVNCFRFLYKTRNFQKTINAFKLANYSLRDAITGIFHFD